MMKSPSVALRLVLTVCFIVTIIGVGFGVVVRSLSNVEAILQSESTEHISVLTVNSTVSRQVFELSSRVQLLEQAFLYSETALSEEGFYIDQQLQQLRDLSNNDALTEKMDAFIGAFHRFLGGSLSLNRILKSINEADSSLNQELDLLDFHLASAKLDRLLMNNAQKKNGLGTLTMMRESYLEVGKLVGTIRSRITPETEKVVLLEIQKELGVFLLHLNNIPVFTPQIQTQKNLLEHHIKRYNASLRQMKANLDQRWSIITALTDSQNNLLEFVENTEQNVQQSALLLKMRLKQDISNTRVLIALVGITVLITGLLLTLKMVSTHIHQPLRKLSIGLHNMESNEFYERLYLGKAGEWKKIETAFNRMASRLQTTYTELNDERQKFNFLAHHDPLTGLINRLLGTTILRETITEHDRSKRVFTVLYLDVDQFKIINDSLGHSTGDELLKNVAHSLTNIVSHYGIVSRMGGDEFMIILNNIHSTEKSYELAEKINAELRRPYKIQEHTTLVSASIGLCHFPQHGQDAETLIRNADTAMYQAKRNGRDCTVDYNSSMTLAADEVILLNNDLHHAIKENELVVFYQPIVDIQTGIIVGAEALVRWSHPTKGLIFPDSFLPLAEKNGLASAVDKWVFEHVVGDILRWKEELKPIGDLLFSVNFSGKKFQEPNLQNELRLALGGHTELAKQIIIEITEREMVLGYEGNIETIEALRACGYRIAIDDFGVGHSSFASLQKIPADIIKLDHSFIDNIENSSRDLNIVRSIKSLVDQLNLEFIIEGIETEQQAIKLKHIGGTLAQGYLYAKPVPAIELYNLVANQKLKYKTS